MYQPRANQVEVEVKLKDTSVHDSVVGLIANREIYQGNSKRMLFLVLILLACAYFYITS